MTNVNHGKIFSKLEEWAPKYLAYDWDPIGLQIGSKKVKTKNVLVTLDVNEQVVDEAISQGANLIIAHHPLLFQPLHNINYESVKGKLIKKIMEHEITVYAAHTNLDIAEGGVNDMLSNALQLDSIEPLIYTYDEKLLKLVVFVPMSHAKEVMDALGRTGAGYIGQYSHCTFQTKGQGTFMPLKGTNPFIGSENKLEIVDEIKIETVIKESETSSIVKAMKAAHPYEEVAYDLYPLKYIGKKYGLGRIGYVNNRMTLEDFGKQVKKTFDIELLKVTGDLKQEVKKVAIVGGSGEKYIHHAKQKGADVYITGDVTFHQAQDAKELGLSVIDAGHYIESIMKKATKTYLANNFSNILFMESKVNTDPFHFM